MGMWAGLAIGAAVATGGPVVAVTGDGAAGFALGELEAVVRHGLAVTVVVVNSMMGASQGFQLRPGAGAGRSAPPCPAPTTTG
ncbi:MAG: thiamine pyrophosphate-dependent enzyme [Acidimicrobiales bacterium]